MTKIERQNAEEIRDKLKKILPDLKRAYENARYLEEKYGWDIFCFGMCEAYMNLAHEYIGIMDDLNEDDGGAE